MPPQQRRRMAAGERREQVLDAAVAAFGDGGYTGTTTDDVARRAGVSQPYVVRMFGTKEALFLAVVHRVMARIEDAFRAAARERDPSTPPLDALGRAYVELATDRDLLRVMHHGFVAATDPALGPAMRGGLTRVYRAVREVTGASPEQVRDFLAYGMLINVFVVLGLPEHLDEDPFAAELVRATLPPGEQERI